MLRMPRGEWIREIYQAKLTVSAASDRFSVPKRIVQDWAWHHRVRCVKSRPPCGYGRRLWLLHPGDVSLAAEQYHRRRLRPKVVLRPTTLDTEIVTRHANGVFACEDQILLAAAAPGATLTAADVAELARRREMFTQYLNRVA
jgi:hypothetical protein